MSIQNGASGACIGEKPAHKYCGVAPAQLAAWLALVHGLWGDSGWCRVYRGILEDAGCVEEGY